MIKRFILRAVALQILFLSIWWWMLRPPSLALLYAASYVPFQLLAPDGSRRAITLLESGDWDLHLPIEAAIPDTAAPGRQIQLRSLDCTIKRGDLVTFTFGLPLFWALSLAAPVTSTRFRKLLFGSVAILVVNVVSLVIFSRLEAWRVVFSARGQTETVAVWATTVGHHLLTNVLPFAVPLFVALALHPVTQAELIAFGLRPGKEGEPGRSQKSRTARV